MTTQSQKHIRLGGTGGLSASVNARRRKTTSQAAAYPFAGFTLVELLVAVGLVVLIMLMFAEVFRSATGMITTQKGIAENDGRERTIQTALLYDIRKRTVKELIPFPNTDILNTMLLDSLPARGGYFTISENDPDNNTDDVLSFTACSSNAVSGLDNDTPYFGRSTSLQNWPLAAINSGGAGSGSFEIAGIPQIGTTTPSNSDLVTQGYLSPASAGAKIHIQDGTPSTVNGVYTISNYSVSGTTTTIDVVETVPAGSSGQLYLTLGNGNEPDLDDEQLAANGTGTSRFAEISYYLRNGNLYRRQHLIREEQETSDVSLPRPQNEAANSSLIPNDYYQFPGSTNSGILWRDFDFSARRVTGEDANENGILDTGGATYDEDDGPASTQLPPDDNGDGDLDGYGVRFHTVANLGNGQSSGQFPLGRPVNRFGYAPSHFQGLAPREYLDLSTPPDPDTFIGRFTQQETSHPDFGYPGYILSNQNPLNMSGLTLTPATGAVTAYEGTDRRGEDIIATNVHEFDVKVFAANFGVDGVPGQVGDDDGDGIADWLDADETVPDLEEVGAANSDDIIGFQDLGRVDNVAAPLVSGLYTRNSNPYYSTYGNRMNRFDTWHVEAGGSPPYRMISNGTDQRAGMANWPDDDNQLRTGFTDWELGPDGSPGNAGDDDGDTIDVDYGADTVPGSVGDDDGNGVVDDDVEIGWVGSDDIVDFDELGLAGSDDVPDRHELGFIGTDDEVPLRAIQIRIRFVDASSNQMRQMTLVYALDELE
ncbi:MAG: hypothetical protein ACKVT0_18985 [Planctomycetaceae bacterium]